MGRLQQALNSIAGDSPSFTPKGIFKPLLKSYQKEKPPLGWPRTTDCLCAPLRPPGRPVSRSSTASCLNEILLNEKVGEIKAQIIERDGKILMGQVTKPSTATLKTSCPSTPPSSSTSKKSSPAATSAPTTTPSSTTTAPPPSLTAVVQSSPSSSPTAAT